MPASPFDRPDLYDALLDDVQFDLPFWLQFVGEGGGPALEVGCGTGRILVRLLEAGFDVDGIDSSRPMLEHARGKIALLGHRSTLTEAAMDRFELPRRFRRILCAFNSFAHNLTTHAQLATLERCRAHLEPGGAFALHLGFPRPEMWTGPTDRVLEHETPHRSGDGVLRIYDTRTFDPVEQTQLSDMDIEHVGADGTLLERFQSHTELRWIYKHELALLLERAGFTRFDFFGDFDRTPLGKDSHTLLAIAWR